MGPFIHDDFLLENGTARRLYQRYAESQPIIDYHCHISAKDIAENRRFSDLFEIWLKGDHYKWRAMRANGVDERYCTGDAKPCEKFLAWAKTVPYTLRNPLYHWTHLELVRYFGIEELLNEETAPRIWREANEQLAGDDLSAQGILRKFKVEVVCSTDDPTDSLEYHQAIAEQGLATRVFPTFRPDAAFRIEDPAEFNGWLATLERAADTQITRLGDLLSALRVRHDTFHQMGCRASDHGLDTCPAEACTEQQAATIFDAVRSGKVPDPEQALQFASFMLLYTAHLDAEKRWIKQLHLGALRNANPQAFRTLGRDTGFDSMGDWPQASALARFMGRLSEENAMPKMILYNVNPTDNYAFATMAGNFQGGTPGKIQFGTGWWFLDQKEGIEWQLNALSNTGLLSRFVGMVTDSRSFMSYPRHEYFRRVLCNLLGGEMERGLLPNDEALVGKMVEAICYGNAAAHFPFPEGVTKENGAALAGSAQ
ncbi:MAG TPA: glucuronate isomerase [Terriglobales bacterium]|nr:glucuronate isomerase [Terriglobales bacterium]